LQHAAPDLPRTPGSRRIAAPEGRKKTPAITRPVELQGACDHARSDRRTPPAHISGALAVPRSYQPARPHA
jgi:hypothetical protein